MYSLFAIIYSIITWIAILLLLATCGIFFGFLWHEKYSKFFEHLMKIPGPKGYPVIGSVYNYFVSTDDLFDVGHSIVKKYYPVHKDWSFSFGSVNIQRPEDIEIVLANSVHIEKGLIYRMLRPWLGTGLLTSSGTKWQKRRKILTPGFHFSILQQFVNIFNEGTQQLLEEIEKKADQDCIDVNPIITHFTLSSIAETSMGIKFDSFYGNWKQYKQAIYTFGKAFVYRTFRPWLALDSIFYLTSVGKSLKDSTKILHEFSTNVIAEKKKKNNNIFVEKDKYTDKKRLAMLDILLSAQRDGVDIDDEGIREEVDTFMFEGYDTTSLALSYIFLLLANHKSAQDEIYQELIEVLGTNAPTYSDFNNLVYMERCIKECLRLYPSVPTIVRLAKTDFKLDCGYMVPKNAEVYIHFYDLHRNPEIYPDPEKFDPDRFLPEVTAKRHPFAYLPFSAGPRNCIGQRFAMLEIKAVLCGLLRKFVLEPVDTPKDVKLLADLVLRSKNPIRVKFRLRQ